MAHRFESGMFVREPAWHGLGTVLDEPPTVSEAIVEARLDWKVTKEPLYTKEAEVDTVGPPLLRQAPDHNALVRSSDRKILGVAGGRYRPLQNIEAFEFFNPFLEKKVATLETAGSLMGGRVVWVLAKLNDFEDEVVANDPVQAHLLLSNSHTGSGAVRVIFTPTRVVCWNTLSAAEAAPKSIVKVVHSKNLTNSLTAVQDAVDVANKTFAFTLADYRAMARKDITVEGLKNYVRDVLSVPAEVKDMPRAWEGIEAAFEGGPGSDIPGVDGTVWGAYNAVTHWVDHQRGRTDESRLTASWFQPGVGPAIRKKAHAEAVALATN